MMSAIANKLIPNTSQNRISNDLGFAICNSCFWCSTLLHYCSSNSLDKCPYCNGTSIDCIRIENNEGFLFSRTEKSGVMLEFYQLTREAGCP
jgi:hypothetical protein